MSRIWKHHVAVIGTALLLASLFGLTGCGKTEKAPTTIMLTSCSNPSLYGESVCFIATVTTESGWISGGTVAFYDGDALLGSRSQTWLQEYGSGQFAFATDMTDLAVGSHDIVAVFEGKGDFAGSTSETLTQLVSQVPAAWERWSLPGDDALYGVWGTSASDVFAVGVQGVILHYDGSTWSTMASFATCGCWDDLHAPHGYEDMSGCLFGVWGSAWNDVYAVGWKDGTGGIILHYDGSIWSTSFGIENVILRDVWGGSSSDVFAVGDGGTILHYAG